MNIQQMALGLSTYGHVVLGVHKHQSEEQSLLEVETQLRF